jgi:SAM-dependent methyltransferase
MIASSSDVSRLPADVRRDLVTIDAACTTLSADDAERLLDRLTAGPHDWIALAAGTEDSAWPNPGTTAWWEARLLARDFGKSPLSAGSPGRLQPDDHGDIVRHPVLFERLSPALIERYPLSVLAREKWLHMDMLREPGTRSDAHLARYRWACRFVQAGMTAIDAACGLGYGSAIIADRTNPLRVRSMDNSEYAIDYARTAWAGRRPSLEFICGDVATLGVDDATAGAVVSFETIEHLQDPAPFLREVRRTLSPGGYFVGSVPNLWIDETGKDPNPYHFHVFDRERLLDTLSSEFDVRELWQQNAAYDADGRAVPPKFHRIGLDGAGAVGKPEWLIFAAVPR